MDFQSLDLKDQTLTHRVLHCYVQYLSTLRLLAWRCHLWDLGPLFQLNPPFSHPSADPKHRSEEASR